MTNKFQILILNDQNFDDQKDGTTAEKKSLPTSFGICLL